MQFGKTNCKYDKKDRVVSPFYVVASVGSNVTPGCNTTRRSMEGGQTQCNAFHIYIMSLRSPRNNKVAGLMQVKQQWSFLQDSGWQFRLSDLHVVKVVCVLNLKVREPRVQSKYQKQGHISLDIILAASKECRKTSTYRSTLKKRVKLQHFGIWWK